MTDAGRRALAALLAVALAVPAARAATFGDIDVFVDELPRGQSLHGYVEIWVRVVNRSESAAREVRLTFPHTTHSPGTDHIRSVTRTLVVEPGQSARVPIAYPERHTLAGSGLGVAVDGRRQDDPIPTPLASHRYGGGRSYGYGFSAPMTPLVFYSRDVPPRFPDWVKEAEAKHSGLPYPPVVIPPTPGGFSTTMPVATSVQTEFARAELPVANWSPNWLGYSRYDGVVVTAADLRAMPPPVRAALASYVECGGSLLVFGAGAPLPGPWKLERLGKTTLSAGPAGFGLCTVVADLDLSHPAPDANQLLRPWTESFEVWQRVRSISDSNRDFPVIDDVSAPTTGLLVLMALFGVLIGPVNLFVLGRMRRKLWLFWTVPAISALTCLSVFGTMALMEGWSATTRVEGVTILDESTRRAATIGVVAVYAPVVPGGGMLFDADTELSYQNGEDPTRPYYMRRNGGAALALDWTRGQHLESGWLAPRAPAHFLVRKGESRRERVTITDGAAGPEAVNALGADAVHLFYKDAAGKMFHAENVAAGAKATLTPWEPDAVAKSDAAIAPETHRDLFKAVWGSTVSRMDKGGRVPLAPRSYLAVLDGAPFLSDGLASAKVRKARSAVFGKLPEGGDAR